MDSEPRSTASHTSSKVFSFAFLSKSWIPLVLDCQEGILLYLSMWRADHSSPISWKVELPPVICHVSPTVDAVFAYVWAFSGFSILFHWSVFPFLQHYHTALINISLYFSWYLAIFSWSWFFWKCFSFSLGFWGFFWSFLTFYYINFQTFKKSKAFYRK